MRTALLHLFDFIFYCFHRCQRCAVLSTVSALFSVYLRAESIKMADWEEDVDPASGYTYYYHTVTGNFIRFHLLFIVSPLCSMCFRRVVVAEAERL